MGERIETFRDVKGVSGVNRSMRECPHAQERANALIKSAVQLTLFVEFLEHRRTINSDEYRETLQNLRKSIKNKRPGLLTEIVVLLHDNKRPHVSRVTHTELTKFKREQLDHPLYSLDWSPCDFYVFGPLKKHLNGVPFNLEDGLKDAGKDCVSSRPLEFWKQGILRLVNQWDRYAQAYGVYFK
ncbi:histone-lysine N-methyltransferase SETMAR [Trichonephila clavipes]|nr:histone-lysine N-methyltransferase SETMAR [Trichonephila clavipes]